MENEDFEMIPLKIVDIFISGNQNIFKLCWINKNNELSYTFEKEENIPDFILAKFWVTFPGKYHDVSTMTELTSPLIIPKKLPIPYNFFSVGISVEKSANVGMIAENSIPIKVLSIDFTNNIASVLYNDNPKESPCDLQILLHMYPTVLIDFLEKELQKP